MNILLEMEQHLDYYKIEDADLLFMISSYIASNLDLYNVDSHFKERDFDNDVNPTILDFYKQLDEKMYQLIKEYLFSDKIKIIKLKKHNGEGKTFSNNDIKDVNTDLILFSNTIDYFLLAHELIHAVAFIKNENTNPKENNIKEIESHFIEQLLDPFLLNKNIDELELLKWKIIKTNKVIKIANRVCWELQFLNIYRKEGTFNESTIEKYIKENNINCNLETVYKMVSAILNEKNTLSYQLRYLWGDIIAVELYKKYLNDPMMILTLFKKYLTINSRLNLAAVLNLFEIDSIVLLFTKYIEYSKENNQKMMTIEK